MRYSDLLQKCNSAKDVYNAQSEIADKSDLKIQEHMLCYERGEVDATQVQQVSKQGVLIKYKAELATNNYKKQLKEMNTALKGEFEETYKPDLMKLQELEEARIGFQKFCMDKYIQTLTTISQTITHVTKQCH